MREVTIEKLRNEIRERYYIHNLQFEVCFLSGLWILMLSTSSSTPQLLMPLELRATRTIVQFERELAICCLQSALHSLFLTADSLCQQSTAFVLLTAIITANNLAVIAEATPF